MTLPIQDAMLKLSQTKVPTISKVLPLLKMIQQHLKTALDDPDIAKDKSGTKYCGLKTGLRLGLEKINIYLEKALVRDYPLLGAGEWGNFYALHITDCRMF
jgi:hypothetical protein